MWLYEVHGYGRDTGRRRKRRYEAADEEAAIHLAADDGTIVERVVCIGNAAMERAKGLAASLRSGTLRNLEPYGIGEHDYETVRATLAERFGHEPNAADVCWGLYNETLKRQTNYGSMAGIYLVMATFLRAEGRSPFQSLRNWARMTLKQWEQTGVVVAVTLLPAPNCGNCPAKGRPRMTIAQALEALPIPCVRCDTKDADGDYEHCTCDYLPQIQ